MGAVSPLPRVPRLWSGSTIICLATGPSLCASDVAAVVASGHPIIAVNDAYRVCQADVLYAADACWWEWKKDVPDRDLPAWKFGLDFVGKEWRPDLITLARTGADGLELRPWGLRSGGHSGYQAINLAVHLGARRIILLGYDLQPAVADATQHHSPLVGDHPNGHHPTYAVRAAVYFTLLAPLADLSITLVNASRATAITALPRVVLQDVLQDGV